MNPTLTPEQRQAVHDHAGAPVYFVDGYVLLRTEQFETLKEHAEKEEALNVRETYPFIDRVMAEDDAHDPTLASYQVFPSRA